jgi:uncharacterized protein (TIGR02391 family)
VVFQAFREVEIAVKELAGMPTDEVGVSMIRKAFAVEKGALTDATLARGEQEAEMHFFSGAIGLFKNPGSHRSDITFEPAEAVELILLASHLLRRLDRARERRTAYDFRRSFIGGTDNAPLGASGLRCCRWRCVQKQTGSPSALVEQLLDRQAAQGQPMPFAKRPEPARSVSN